MRKETSLMASRGRSVAQPWVWFSEMSALSNSLSLISIQSLWQMSVTPVKRFPPNAILFNDTHTHCQQPRMLSNGGTFAISDCLSLLTGLLTLGSIARIIIIVESAFGTTFLFKLNDKMKAVKQFWWLTQLFHRSLYISTCRTDHSSAKLWVIIQLT